MRECRGVVQLLPEDLEHGGGALRVHMDLVEALRQLLLVVHADHLEEVQMSAENELKNTL